MANSYPLRFADQLRQHLRALRKRHGLTQSELGKLIGVSQARIAEIEANPGAVSFEQMMQLLSTLGGTLVLQEDDQVSYPLDRPEENTKKARNKTRLGVAESKQPGGKVDFAAVPKFTFNIPPGEWRSHAVRQAGPYSAVTGVLVSPPTNDKSKSGEETSSHRQTLQALNRDKDGEPTSRRNFVIRPKKGSW